MAFNIPNQTSYVLQRPVDPQPEWTRQPDWVSVTDTPGEVQFVVTNLGLSAYTINTVYTKPAAQNLYIDWGDGTVDTISTATSTNTSHTYTTAGTPCSRGYDTYKVRVYVDSGARITTCRFGVTPGQTNSGYPIGVLEAYYGDVTVNEPNQINFVSSSSFYGTYPYLEYVKLPSIMSGASGMDSTFNSCRALAKVVMPVSAANISTFNLAFQACSALQTIVLPQDATSVTNFNGTFASCVSLTGATLPPTLNSVTTSASMFSACNSLSTIKLPPMLSCTNYGNMFSTCYSLITVEIPSFHSGTTTVDINSMFINCRSLEYIKLPTTVTAGNTFLANGMFNGCYNLKSCILPTNFNATTMSAMFSSCFSLSSVTLPTSIPSLTDMSSMFSTCYNLQEITLPTTIGATVAMNGMFSSCSSISKIVVPSSYNITLLQQAFINCTNLITLELPNNAQNSLTQLAQLCSGCVNLKSVILPTSMNGLVNIGSAFNGCTTLQSITLPSTLPSLATMGSMCLNCTNLQSVTLPTSTAALTTGAFVQSFQACSSIKTITLPATVNVGLNSYLNAFNGCTALETVTLPTTQTTAVTTVNNMFSACPALKTVNNIQYIGNTSTAATIYLDGTAFSTTSYQFTGNADFYCKFSILQMNGTVTIQSNLTSLRLRNNGTGQYAGASPQINISYTNLNAAALDQVFTDLPTVTAKTINITGALGAAGCTRSIATGKGWTVTG